MCKIYCKYFDKPGFYKKLGLSLIALSILVGCSIQDFVGPIQDPELKLINEYNLSVSEPSGLTLNSDFTELWTVSDNTNHVYKLSLTGNVLRELNYEGNDLEGIVFDSSNNTLLLVEERLREIVNIDLNGNEISRQTVNLPGTANSGLEGICLDTTNTIYVLNEKQPNIWAKLKSDFSTQFQKEINEVGDLSGMTYDKINQMFWIVSDESKQLFRWDTNQGTVKSFDLSFAKAEGVAYDYNQNRIYIVSDETNKLYIYDLNEN